MRSSRLRGYTEKRLKDRAFQRKKETLGLSKEQGQACDSWLPPPSTHFPYEDQPVEHSLSEIAPGKEVFEVNFPVER